MYMCKQINLENTKDLLRCIHNNSLICAGQLHFCLTRSPMGRDPRAHLRRHYACDSQKARLFNTRVRDENMDHRERQSWTQSRINMVYQPRDRFVEPIQVTLGCRIVSNNSIFTTMRPDTGEGLKYSESAP